MTTKFLLTGAMGCIGAHVIRQLIDDGADFIASDLATDRARPGLIMSDDELNATHWTSLDVTDTKAVHNIVADNGVTHIIHLAGLQIPFCRANPALGAAVNVTGTVNIFEAARHNDVRGLAYASSLAALGPPDLYENPVADDALPQPATLYGVYKVANEETARIFWQDWNVGSIGLRPNQVYGIGRDQGVTADIAKSILATAVGVPFHIRYDGPITLQHAPDVARIFIDCALKEHQGHAICNLRNDVTTVADYLALLRAEFPDTQITNEEGKTIPFPADLSDANLQSILGTVPHTPLADAIRTDVAAYRTLLQSGKLDLKQLGG